VQDLIWKRSLREQSRGAGKHSWSYLLGTKGRKYAPVQQSTFQRRSSARTCLLLPRRLAPLGSSPGPPAGHQTCRIAPPRSATACRAPAGYWPELVLGKGGSEDKGKASLTLLIQPTLVRLLFWLHHQARSLLAWMQCFSTAIVSESCQR
jgi:hypothetical protein